MSRAAHLLAALAAGCGAAQTVVEGDPHEAREAIAHVVDDWHDAAARSDEARYFDHMTEDAIFLGTDATERWTKAAFRAYAHPHFARGNGWVMRSIRRDVIVDGRGRLAWLDEDLEAENLGPARGSGVLRFEDGRWRIAHYNLAITVPNPRFDEVRALLASPPPAAP